MLSHDPEACARARAESDMLRHMTFERWTRDMVKHSAIGAAIVATEPVRERIRQRASQR